MLASGILGLMGKIPQRLRFPKLSTKPDSTGRYYAAYRDADDKCQKKRFSSDRADSKTAYRTWLRINYRQIAPVVNEGPAEEPPDVKGATKTAMPSIVVAYVDYQRGRVRPDGVKRSRGLIELPEAEAIKGQIMLIANWAKARFGSRFREAPFETLFCVTDYNQMMQSFVKAEYAPSSVHKLVARFWHFVTWAANPPFSQTIRFNKSQVDKFGSLKATSEWEIPSVGILQRILQHASLRFRAIIWMAIGCGFGNDDIAKVKPLHFDEQDYDLRRGKTGVPRSGKTPPLVWSYIQACLKQDLREPGDILFIGRTGKPLVYTRTKNEYEMKHGTTTKSKPGKSAVVQVDAIRSSWERLLVKAGIDEEWWAGFYVLRHLGCTAAAQRLNMLDLYSFMGHTGAKVLHRYMQKVTPSTRPTIEWVNNCLMSTNLSVWEPEPKPETPSTI
jgi:integrase